MTIMMIIKCESPRTGVASQSSAPQPSGLQFRSWSLVVLIALVVIGGHWWSSLMVIGGHWWSSLFIIIIMSVVEIFLDALTSLDFKLSVSQ